MLSSQDLFDGVRMIQLDNPDATTWSESVLVVALNQALGMMTLVRPEATAKTGIMVVQQGARQTIPLDGVSLIRVNCNVTADNTPARTVRLVEKEDLDSASRSWMSAQGTQVAEYTFDARTPRQFFIYPNVPADTAIEIEYSAALPKILTSNINDINVDAIYLQPIKEFMLYTLLSGIGNADLGALHLRMALDLLGVKDLHDQQNDPAKK